MEKPLTLICSQPAPAQATYRFLVVCRLLVLLPALFSMETCEGGTPDESSSNDVPAKKKNVGAEKRLTFDGHLKHDPVFVESGKAIVYTSLEKFNQLCLMKVGFPVNGETEPVRFHGAASTSELMATFSKDDRVYAYLRNNGNLHFEIVLEDRGAGKSVSYNPGGGFAGVRNISYAPDGTNVIFAFPNQNGPQQIQSLDRDGKTVSLLTDSNGVNVCPSYSRDGSQIVYSSSRDGDFDIFTMNSDGSNPVNVTQSPGMDTHPCFSPDRKKIAFTSIRKGNYDIYLLEIASRKVQRLTSNPEVDDYPCWSPDGKTVVWVAERNGKRDLYSRKIE